jgi:hypothetical protein
MCDTMTSLDVTRAMVLSMLLLGVLWCQLGAQGRKHPVLDDFDNEPNAVNRTYPDLMSVQQGYEVYYKSAVVQLSRIGNGASNPREKVLRVKFDLPPTFEWGNWCSIRRDYEQPIDLDGYTGLELMVRVDQPSSEAFLRISLADLASDSLKTDELWWFDCDKSLLSLTPAEWTRISIPFNRFVCSHGAGTRHNDYKLNLKKIIAYEINIVSYTGKHAAGMASFDSLRAR